MEEIPNNQLGRKNPCKYWNKLPTKWLKIYKISSINSTIPLQLACNNLFAKHRYHNELEIERRNWPEYFGPSQVKPTRNQDTVKETTRNTFWGSWSVVWNLVMFWRWSFIIYSNKKNTPTDKLGTVSYMHLASFCWSNVTCILQDPPLLYLAHFGGIPILVLPEDMLPTRSGPLK